MLNEHPLVFCLYEVDLYQDQVSKYGQMLLERYPQFRPLFTTNELPIRTYVKLEQGLRAQGFGYRAIGDKNPGLRFDLMASAHEVERVVFCCRDIRTWLAKTAVATTFCTAPDIVPTATAYTRFLINSYRLPIVHRLYVETMLKDPIGEQRALLDFIGVRPSRSIGTWWETVAKAPEGDPKAVLPWWRSHPSSLLAPVVSDTSVTLSDHPFWNELLPVFDKYFGRVDRPSEREIATDLAALRRISSDFQVPASEAYSLIDTTILTPKSEAQTDSP